MAGGMIGKEYHMDKHEEHMSREGHSKGQFGTGHFHKQEELHHKAAGYGQKSGHGSVKAAKADTSMHSGKMPNNC